MMAFCNLHVHNEYSLLDGVGKADDWCKRAKELGQTHLALTNHGNIDGLLNFQQAAIKNGIVPLLGCELYVVSDIAQKTKDRFHITVLIKNEIGLKNLCEMLSIANLAGFYYKPRVDYKTILDHCDGLVWLSGCALSPIIDPMGEKFLWRLHRKVKDDFYFEIMPHIFLKQIGINAQAFEAAEQLGVKVVATNDCHYIRREDNELQETLLAIQTKAKWKDKNRFRFDIEGLHLRSEKEMLMAFKEQMKGTDETFLKAINNTMEVAKKCENFRIEKKDILLPAVNGLDLKGEANYLRKLCFDGYRKIFGTDDWPEEYLDRFMEEFRLIKKKNFVRYFLIVHELINWSRDNGIMVGPGRGSSAGSLIAFLIGITCVNPLEHGLIFSRFIDENRIDYPDIDIDFEDVKKPRQHLEDVYGKNNIASVSTFMRMKGRGVIRDVSRVFDVPLNEVDDFAKVIVDEGNDSVAVAVKETEEGKYFAEKYPKVVDFASRLEGQIRGASKHAAAVIVSAEDLTKCSRCNIVMRSGQEVVNWEKEDAEFCGLMKLDNLALINLKILNHARKLIKRNHDKDIVFETIKTNDRRVFNMLGAGGTVGVFQFGTWATTKLTKSVGVESFGAMNDIVALVRPGPFDSGMTDDYVDRKKGKKWKKKHRIYEEITKNTFGIIIYQEQVMQVISKVAGLSYSTADKIRKIISKKRDQKMFAEYFELFVQGCKDQQTLSEKEAREFWEALQSHSRYSFNKCLTGDTVLIRSAAGKYCKKEMTIKELFDNWNSKKSVGKKLRRIGVNIFQLKADNRIRPGKVKGVYLNGVKEVFEIETESGLKIKATENHRFLTKTGYTVVSGLKIGDLLAAQGESEKYKKKGFCNPGKGSTYSGFGFRKDKENICYIDGRKKMFDDAKRKVKIRANGKCEFCGKMIVGRCKESGREIKYGRPEMAHIKSLNHFNYDFSKYHSEDNILYLCNNCHKSLDYEKGERKIRHSKGKPIFFDKIKNISFVGEEETFDIEMEGPNHNFIANGFVSHNSHSVCYALISYWCAYLKTCYPAEFICASLTHGGDGKKEELVDEARRLGLNVVLPKIGVSDAIEWVTKDNDLFVPFVEIKGIGEKSAPEIAKYKAPSKNGFFSLGTITRELSPKIKEILTDVGSFGDEPVGNVSSFFSFNVGNKKKDKKVFRYQ